MNKKIDITELDIPTDDIEAWERYPKHHWVYDLSRLLDAQNIKWSPYRTDELDTKMSNMKLESKKPISFHPSVIYVKALQGQEVITEAYITKGEIRFFRHIDKATKKEITTEIGEVELRLNAFVTLHFQKFTGVVTADFVGHDIYSIRLRPYNSVVEDTNQEILRLKKRIYKKIDFQSELAV